MVVKIHHLQEPLQLLHCGWLRKRLNDSGFVLQRTGTSLGDEVAQIFHLGPAKDTFLQVKDQPKLPQSLQKQLKMAVM
jgi:hypothetical protein